MYQLLNRSPAVLGFFGGPRRGGLLIKPSETAIVDAALFAQLQTDPVYTERVAAHDLLVTQLPQAQVEQRRGK